MEAADIPYKTKGDPSDLDKKFRLYEEADSLYRLLMDNIMYSDMTSLVKAICLFTIKTQWLDRLLNDLYDSLVITAMLENPLVTYGELPGKTARSFKRNGEVCKISDLTMGVKHTVLAAFRFKNTEDEEDYQNYLDQLKHLIDKRNRVVHELFSQKVGIAEKMKLIKDNIIELEKIIIATNKYHDVFSHYLLENRHKYW